MIKQKKRKKYLVLLIFIFGVLACLKIYRQAEQLQKVIKEYNIAVNEYNSVVNEYNEAIRKSCVDNISGMPTTMGLIKNEDESLVGATKVIFSSNSKEKIESDIQTLYGLTDSINTCNQIVKQIETPSEEWVLDRLKNVSVIKGTQSVTEKNNPDGLLGNNGGYISCVYFLVDGLDVSDVPGKTIVEKGCDAGGAIEIYATLEEAEARCEYLKGFDDTILYSGSYAIVGTMVVRASYMLAEEDQLYLTNEIVKSFTVLEEQEVNEDVFVETIEAYMYTSSFLVMKKTVTDETEIKRICDTIQSINYEEYDWSMTPATIGPAPILFKIYLSDGTVHQVKFLTYGERGEQIVIDDKEYRYEGDAKLISDLWDELSGDIQQVDRNDV